MDPSLSIAKLVPDPAKCGVINYVCIIEIELVQYQRWWLSVLLWRNLSDRGFDYCSYMITPYSYVPNKSFQSYCRHLEGADLPTPPPLTTGTE